MELALVTSAKSTTSDQLNEDDGIVVPNTQHGRPRTDGGHASRYFAAAFLAFAQRAFCAAAILARPSALIRLRLCRFGAAAVAPLNLGRPGSRLVGIPVSS